MSPRLDSNPLAGRYGAYTDVAVDKSKREIEALLRRHGATHYGTGWDETHDKLQFAMHGQTIRFVIPRPDPKDPIFTHDRAGRVRASSHRQRLIEQADRQRWRALYLVIRAKIEAVEAGIAIFEQEFLAFIVGPEDLTIGDILVPRIQAGSAWKLLPAMSETRS